MPMEWADVAKQLDPNMPEEDYNKVRLQYFHSQVAPKVRQGYSVESTMKDFMAKTERPKTMGAGERALVKAGLFSTAAVESMIPGVDVSEQKKLLTGIADREGISKGLPEGAGKFLGQGLAMAPLFEITGPLSQGLAATFLRGAKTIDVATKIARGGLAFGAYDALEAKDGDRVGAGLRGAMWGALAETGMGAVFGFSDKVAKGVVQNALNEKLPGPIGKLEVEQSTPRIVAEQLQTQVKEARAQGYLTGPMVETPSIKGLRVITKDAEGMPTIHNVPRGKESEVIGMVEETLANGGEIDGIHFHPASRARASEFMRHFAEKAETEEQPLRMKTLAGKSEEVAKQLNKMGLRGTVADDSTVMVGPEAAWVKAQRAKAVAKTVAQQQAGRLTPAAPDDVSEVHDADRRAPERGATLRRR